MTMLNKPHMNVFLPAKLVFQYAFHKSIPIVFNYSEYNEYNLHWESDNLNPLWLAICSNPSQTLTSFWLTESDEILLLTHPLQEYNARLVRVLHGAVINRYMPLELEEAVRRMMTVSEHGPYTHKYIEHLFSLLSQKTQRIQHLELDTNHRSNKLIYNIVANPGGNDSTLEILKENYYSGVRYLTNMVRGFELFLNIELPSVNYVLPDMTSMSLSQTYNNPLEPAEISPPIPMTPALLKQHLYTLYFESFHFYFSHDYVQKLKHRLQFSNNHHFMFTSPCPKDFRSRFNAAFILKQFLNDNLFCSRWNYVLSTDFWGVVFCGL
ncbi:protein ORF27 [Lake sturgeon herpesvirus]|nr:protein ORF27 [Lake sturgeon herpesvirus]